MTYQVKSWFGASVPGVVSHSAVRSLASKWFQISTEREPLLADFWHETDEAFIDNTILLLKSESDYTYLHHGRTLRQKIGFSMQGLRLSELRTKARPMLVDIYDRVTADFSVCYFQSFSDFQIEVVLWGRLALPVRLSRDDPRVAIVLYCHPIEDKTSIYKALFEQSKSGIVIAAPVKNDGGGIVDGWVIAQNEPARQLMGIFDRSTPDLLLRQSRIFAREDVWASLTDGLTQRTTVLTLTDPANGVVISVQTEFVDEYVVVRMTTLPPVSETFVIDQEPG